MPLVSFDCDGRDEGRLVSFLMRDGAMPIRCYIQMGALDAIEQARTENAGERLTRFDQHRAMFEAVASDLYDAGLPLQITADHLTLLRGSSR